MLQWCAWACCIGAVLERVSARVLAPAIVLAYITRDYGGWIIMILLFALPWPRLVASAQRLLSAHLSSTTFSFVRWSFLIYAIFLIAADWTSSLSLTLNYYMAIDYTELIYGLLHYNLFWPVASCVFLLTSLLSARALKLLATLFVVVSSAVGMLMFDQRNPFEKPITRCTGIPACRSSYENIIQPGALVFWEGVYGVKKTWFGLETAHYASNAQSASRVFSRQQSILDEQRLLRVTNRVARDRSQGGRYRDTAEPWPIDSRLEAYDSGEYRPPSLDANDIVRLCADPALDYVVAGLRYPQFHPFLIEDGEHHQIYTCNTVRTAPK
jgi:hypothetical protein